MHFHTKTNTCPKTVNTSWLSLKKKRFYGFFCFSWSSRLRRFGALKTKTKKNGFRFGFPSWKHRFWTRNCQSAPGHYFHRFYYVFEPFLLRVFFALQICSFDFNRFFSHPGPPQTGGKTIKKRFGEGKTIKTRYKEKQKKTIRPFFVLNKLPGKGVRMFVVLSMHLGRQSVQPTLRPVWLICKTTIVLTAPICALFAIKTKETIKQNVADESGASTL